MSDKKTILCLGAGGFISSNLVKKLKDEGHFVIGADLKYPEYWETEADDFKIVDLRDYNQCKSLFGTYQYDEVFQMAADMAGACYIFTGDHDANIMHNSAQINLNIAELASEYKVGKLFFSSSACIYSEKLQTSESANSLKEEDAWEGKMDSCYGVEKLFSEELFEAYRRNRNLNIRVARFHNIFGRGCTMSPLKSKAPTAVSVKVANTESGGKIDILGTGNQVRSFLEINQCLEAVDRLMYSDYYKPLNIGSEEAISINNLAKMVINISGKDLKINNILDSNAIGVNGRNSNNELIYKVLGWKPTEKLQVGMTSLYKWVNQEINKKSHEKI